MKTKGIPPNFHGVKGRSGRKPKIIEMERQKKLLNELDSKAITIIEQALDSKDKNTAIWVYEQNHGKAKQAIDFKAEVTIDVGPDLLEAHRRSIAMQSQALLEGQWEKIEE